MAFDIISVQIILSYRELLSLYLTGLHGPPGPRSEFVRDFQNFVGPSPVRDFQFFLALAWSDPNVQFFR